MTVVVLDIGTTGTKSFAFNEKGEIIAKAYKKYPITVQPPGISEQDPNEWWHAACETMRQVMSYKSVKQNPIDGISLTTLRGTTTLIDKKGNVIHPAITWMDGRTIEMDDELKDKISQRMNLHKLLWLKKHKPNVFNKADKFVQVDAYFYHRMVDRWISDYSNARMDILDFSTLDWSEELAEEIKIPTSRWVELKPAGTHLGGLSEEASKDLGLPTGLPVVMGGGDQQCSMLGLGILNPGIAKATTGTGTFVVTQLDNFKEDPMGVMFTVPHVIERKWLIEGVLPGTGAIYQWYKDQFCLDEVEKAKLLDKDPYTIIDNKAQEIKPGSDELLVIPLFNYRRGIIDGLSFGHTKQHLARAILEGTGFGIRHYISMMEDLMELSLNELRIDGGGAKSILWRQIQCDITGKKVVVPQVEEASALGAAILALKTIGTYKTYKEAIDNTVKILETRNPNLKNKEIYEKLFERYQDLLLGEIPNLPIGN